MKRHGLYDFLANAYRNIIFPLKKIGIERRTDSCIKSSAYLYNDSVLEGKNYIGIGVELNHVKVGFGSYVNNSSRLTNTVIGKYTSIAPDVVTVIGKHPVTYAAMHPAFCSSKAAMGYTYVDEDSFEETKWIDKDKGIQIQIGNDVWIGSNVLIMEGVTIGDGAVVGAGSVVTKDVAPYEIVAGVPAKSIRRRFDDETVSKLLDMKWWDKDEAWIKEHAKEFKNPEKLIKL